MGPSELFLIPSQNPFYLLFFFLKKKTEREKEEEMNRGQHKTPKGQLDGGIMDPYHVIILERSLSVRKSRVLGVN